MVTIDMSERKSNLDFPSFTKSLRSILLISNATVIWQVQEKKHPP